MDEVFAGKTTEVERKARRDMRAMFERQTVLGLDPRAVAFCREDGPEVFASVVDIFKQLLPAIGASEIEETDTYE